jgi:hypothetical protein
MAEREIWCRVRLVNQGGTELGRYSFEGYGEPDLTAVDIIARLSLVAGRQEAALVLEEVSDAMSLLLHLAGLSVQVEGQAEGREEPDRI